MKETVVEVKDVSIKFNMSSEKYDSFKEYADCHPKRPSVPCSAVSV